MKSKSGKLLVYSLITLVMLNFVFSPAITSASYADKQNKSSDTDSVKYSEDRILVKFDASMSQRAKEVLKSKLNIKTVKKFSLSGSELVKLKDREDVSDAIEKISKAKGVVYAEPDYIVKTNSLVNDPRFGELWGLHNTSDIDIDAPEAWDITLGAREIIVAVIDEGIDLNHPDIAANIWTNPEEVPNDGLDNDGNGYVDDIHGWDFYHADNSVFDAADGDDHGTHVAGTIAAMANNSTGVAGVAPNIKIMPLKILGPNGGYTSDAIAAIEYAGSMGVRLASNSWGGGGYSTALRDAINVFDGVFVAAAGNDGLDTDASPHYPSSYDSANIISVAAVDSKGSLAYFSNYGTSTVDVGAPGVSILSLAPNSSYGYMSGTSMATPHISGIAALMMSLNSSLAPDQVVELVKQASVPMASHAGKTVSGGMANAYQAVEAIKGGGPFVTGTAPLYRMKEVPLNQIITVTFNENVAPGESFGSITLTSSGTAIPANVSIDGSTISIVPSALDNDSQYTLDIPAGAVQNEAGEGLFMPYTLDFSTPDTLAPTVASMDPAAAAVDVPIHNGIKVKYNEPIKEGASFAGITINGLPLEQHSRFIDGDTIYMYPQQNRFEYATLYNIVIPDGAVSDKKGNLFEGPYSFSFTTEADTLPPSVSYTDPYDGAANITLSSSIMVQFDDEVYEGESFGDITIAAGSVLVETNKSINGSTLSLQPIDKLSPDTTYTVTLPVSAVVDSFGNSFAQMHTFSFTTGIYDVAELPFYPDDAVIDPERPVLYMLSGSDAKLYAYNYLDGTTTGVSLTYAPVSIDIGSGTYADEIYVALSGWTPTPYGRESTEPKSIAILDRTTLALKDTISIGIEPFDLVAGRDGQLYVTPAEGQWADLLSFDRASKSQTDMTSIRHMSFAKLHPAMDRLYTVDTDLSPQDHRAYNISGGMFTDPHYPGGYDSPYHGDYPLDDNFALDPTGRYLFNGSGHIFTTSPEQAEDMMHAAVLDSKFMDIAFEDDLTSFYTLPNVTYASQVVNSYRGKDFMLEGTLGIARAGRFVFKQDSKLVIILEPAGSAYGSGIQVLDIIDQPPAVLSTDPADQAVNVSVDIDLSVSFSEDVVTRDVYGSITLANSSGSVIPVSVSTAGSDVTITPEELNYSTKYTLTIPQGTIEDMGGNTLAYDFTMSFTTMPEPDRTAPIMISQDPADGAANLPLSQVLTVAFSENIQIGDAYGSITLQDGSGMPVAITKRIYENRLTVIPDTLNYSTQYRLNVPGGAVQDTAGNALASSVSISFSTEPEPDIAAPVIVASTPIDGAVNLSLDQAIAVTFSEDILPGSAYNAVALKDSGGNTVTATKTITGSAMTITPSTSLQYSTGYTLTIPMGAVEDTAGNALASSVSISFSTLPEPDTSAPSIIATDPVDGADNVPLNTKITITFNEAVQAGDNAGGITINRGNKTINYMITVVNNQLTLDPGTLTPRSTYTVYIPSGAVKDIAGNPLSTSYTVNFRTSNK